MKFATTILTSLLLLGVGSARIPQGYNLRSMDDNMKRTDADYSKTAQDHSQESSQDKAGEWKRQRMGQSEDTRYEKLTNGPQQQPGKPYHEYLYLFDGLPEWVEPLNVGSTMDQNSNQVVNYDNVQFYGLNSSTSATLRDRTDSQTATLTLSMRKAEVRGHYKTSDNKSGNFTIKMIGHLIFVSNFSYVRESSSKVRMTSTNGEMFYNSYISDYENLSPNHPAVQKDLQQNLLRLVDDKLRQLLDEEYSHSIQKLIDSPFAFDEPQEDSVQNAIRRGINDAVDGIQRVVSKHGVLNIGLASDNKEMVHNKLHAKIASIKLIGLEKLYLANNQVSNENTDKVHATMQLAVDRPTATAILHIHETQEENAPFQEIKVDFNMEKLMANLGLQKSTRQSRLEVRSIQTKVNRIWPVDTEKFEDRVNQLIKEKLAGHMKRSVEEGLKNFLGNELSRKFNRVQPESQEKQYYVRSQI